MFLSLDAVVAAKAMALVGRYMDGLRKLDQSDPVVAFLTDQLQASLEQLPAKLWPENFRSNPSSPQPPAARKTRTRTLANTKVVSIGDFSR